MIPRLTWPALVSLAFRLGWGDHENSIGWGEVGLVEHAVHELLHAQSLGLVLHKGSGLAGEINARLTARRDRGVANETMVLAAEGLLLRRLGIHDDLIEDGELDLAGGSQGCEAEHIWSLRTWTRTRGLVRQVEEWLRTEAAVHGAHADVVRCMIVAAGAAGCRDCCIAALLTEDVSTIRLDTCHALCWCTDCLDRSPEARALERRLRCDESFEKSYGRVGRAIDVYAAAGVPLHLTAGGYLAERTGV